MAVNEAGIPRSRLSDFAFVLLCASPALPVLAWIVAQFLTVRISHASEWTDAWIETLSIDVFAFVFLISTITNLLIVLRRRRDSPLSFTRPLRLPLWVGILYVLSIAWIAYFGLLSIGIDYFEQAVCLAIAAASVVVCVWARKGDETSRSQRALRMKRRRARNADPAIRALLRKRRIAVFVAGGVLLGGIFALLIVNSVAEHQYRNCVAS